MRPRRLSVYFGQKGYPRILMQGQWLLKLGFNVGDQIEIIEYNGSILIKKVPLYKEREGRHPLSRILSHADLSQFTPKFF